MNIQNISIRSRFLLLLCCSVLFWGLAGFVLLSQLEQIARIQETRRVIDRLPDRILTLENSIHSFYLSDLTSESFHETGRSEGIARFNHTCLETYTLCRELKDDPVLRGKPLIQQKLDHLMEYLNNTETLLETFADKCRERGWGSYGLNGVLTGQAEALQSFPESGSAIRELLSELQPYLRSPDGRRMNSLRTRIRSTEFPFAGTGPDSPDQAPENITIPDFLNNIRNLLQLDQELGFTEFEGIRSQIRHSLRILQDDSTALSVVFGIRAETQIRKIRWILIGIILFSAALYAAALYFLSRTINRHLRNLIKSMDELAAGRFPEIPPSQGTHEFSGLSRRLDDFIRNLENKALFAADLAEGKDPEPLQPLSRDDSLGNSLIGLEQNLQAARTEEERHRISREQRRWANEGVAKFSDILRIYNNDICTLAEKVIEELIKSLDASAGGIFLLDSESDEPLLDLVASFAYDRRKYLQKSYRIGEGLVGTCAIEKDKIFLSEIPEDYLNIASGLGESRPSCLLLMPLQLEEATLGVIEIASLRVFEGFEIEFVENLAGSIASAVSTVQMNMQTARLLEQSQQQAREMAEQEEIMRQHVEELQATQEESARRESEISGILNGINNSSHVAEFNMDEELISINDKFLDLLNAQRSQLMGKKYHEIAGMNRHTESYRQFWQELSEGKTVSRIDKIALLTGNDIWLRQTFTPIPDKDGNPFKVLNIAADITETVEQKESLERQSAEIRRTNIEMKSFNDAVDQALIKCVYSPAGQILEVNENYEHATGFTAREMLGKNNRVFLQRVEKEHFDKIWDDILKDKPYSGVIRRTKPTGEEVWIMSTFTPVKDENGNVFKVFYLGQDITERKLKYQLLEEANREIDRLRKQLDERS